MEREKRGKAHLSLVVVFETNVVEVVDDVFRSSILLDLASGIETNHVRSVDLV